MQKAISCISISTHSDTPVPSSIRKPKAKKPTGCVDISQQARVILGSLIRGDVFALFKTQEVGSFKGVSKAASCSKPKEKAEDAAVFVGKPIEARFGQPNFQLISLRITCSSSQSQEFEAEIQNEPIQVNEQNEQKQVQVQWLQCSTKIASPESPSLPSLRMLGI